MTPDQIHNSPDQVDLVDSIAVLQFDRASPREVARAVYSLLGPEFPDALARLKELDPVLAGLVAREILATDRTVLSARIIDAAMALHDQFPFSAGESLKGYVAAPGRIGQIVLGLLAEPSPLLVDYSGSKFLDEVAAVALSSLTLTEADLSSPVAQEELAYLRECTAEIGGEARAGGANGWIKTAAPHALAALSRAEFPDLNVIRRTLPQPRSSWLNAETQAPVDSIRRIAIALDDAPVSSGAIDRETHSIFSAVPRIYILLQEPLAKARHVAGLPPLFSVSGAK